MGAFRRGALSVAVLVGGGTACSNNEVVGSTNFERPANGQRVAEYVIGMTDGTSFGVGVGSVEACGEASQSSVESLLDGISSDPRIGDVKKGIELGHLAITTGAFTCADLDAFHNQDRADRSTEPFILPNPYMDGYFDN